MSRELGEPFTEGELQVLLDWFHANCHLSACRYSDANSKYVEGTGATGARDMTESGWSLRKAGAAEDASKMPHHRDEFMELRFGRDEEKKKATHFPLLLRRNRLNETKFVYLEKVKHSVEGQAAGEGLGVPQLEVKAAACRESIVNRTADADQKPGEGGVPEFCALDIMDRQYGLDSLAAGKLFSGSVSDYGTVWSEEARQIASLRARMEDEHSVELTNIGWPADDSADAWATAVAKPSVLGALNAAKAYMMNRLQGKIEHQVMEVDRCRAKLMDAHAAADAAATKRKIGGYYRKIERYLTQWTWWLEFSPAAGGPAAGWEEKAANNLASIAKDPRRRNPGAPAPSPYELFAARVFPWDDEVVLGASRELLMKYWDCRQELKRRKEEREVILPNDLMRALSYYELEVARVDDLLAHLNVDLPAVKAELAARSPDCRTDSLRALVHNMRRAELRDRLASLRYQRMQLARHKAFAEDQLEKGRYVRDNWWGKGRAFEPKEVLPPPLDEVDELEADEAEEELTDEQMELEEEEAEDADTLRARDEPEPESDSDTE